MEEKLYQVYFEYEIEMKTWDGRAYVEHHEEYFGECDDFGALDDNVRSWSSERGLKLVNIRYR